MYVKHTMQMNTLYYTILNCEYLKWQNLGTAVACLNVQNVCQYEIKPFILY